MDEPYIIETRDLTKHFIPSTDLINFFPRAFKKKPVVKAVDRPPLSQKNLKGAEYQDYQTDILGI